MLIELIENSPRPWRHIYGDDRHRHEDQDLLCEVEYRKSRKTFRKLSAKARSVASPYFTVNDFSFATARA